MSQAVFNRVTGGGEHADGRAPRLPGVLGLHAGDTLQASPGVSLEGPAVVPVSDAVSTRTLGEFLRQSADVALDTADREALGGLALEKRHFVSPELASEARLLPVDEAIADKLHYLEEVCARPREALTTIESVEPMRRSRLLTSRSLDHLARHPRNWEQMTLSGPRPSAILTRLPEVVFDIYENRVALSLLDYLRTYLDRRIAQVERARAVARAVDVRSVSRFVRARLSKEAGQLFELQNIHDQAADALEVLMLLARRVRGLGESPLAKVLRRAPRETRLRSTNIFKSDARYRRVAELWRAARGSDDVRLDPRGVLDRDLGAAQSFVSFARAIALDAASLVRAHFADTDVPGAFDISLDGATLRVVAVPARWGTTEEAAERTVDELQHVRCPRPTLIAYLGEWETLQPIDHSTARRQLLAWGCEFERLAVDGCAPAAIPLSPFSLRSRETMAAAVRACLVSRAWLQYPPRWKPDRRLVEAGLAAASVELASEAAVQARIAEVAGLRPPPLWKAKQRHDLEAAKTAARNDLRALDAQLAGLTTCPRCGRAGRLESRDQRTFEGRCADGCGASWGLRTVDRSRVPFILPNTDERGAVATLMPGADSAQCVELFGRDLLARPRLDDDGSWRFAGLAAPTHQS